MKPINPDINLQNNIQCNRVLESRDFYKGKSFHYAGPWTVGTTYHSDSYIQDFVSFGGALLVCTQTHLSDQSNIPILNYSDSEEKLPTSLQSNRYWSFVIGAVKGEKGETGKQGNPGKDGVGIDYISDSLTTETGFTTVKIGLTDGSEEVIDIPNGKDGANGIDGKDGDTIESITRVDGTNKFNFNFHTAEHDTKSIELDLTDVLEQWKENISVEGGPQYFNISWYIKSDFETSPAFWFPRMEEEIQSIRYVIDEKNFYIDTSSEKSISLKNRNENWSVAPISVWHGITVYRVDFEFYGQINGNIVELNTDSFKVYGPNQVAIGGVENINGGNGINVTNSYGTVDISIDPSTIYVSSIDFGEVNF